MPELGLFQNIWLNLALVILLSGFFVWAVHRLSIVNWRLLDLCALVLGAVGFLIPAFEVQRMGFEIEANAQKGWTGGELSGLQIVTNTMLANCRSAIRSEYSPPDFDLLVEESEKVCKWTEQLDEFVDDLDRESYQEVPEEFFASFPSVREVPVGYHKDKFFEFLNDWNRHVRERKSVEAKSQRSPPIALILLSPYLLALAFSLAVAGVLLKPRQ
ncbi:hypothetical protein ACN2XU_03055 [Primorskyibacter sp. 2E107]|uniref:hypothetical protein n=1 Tax=Primorskyibacter sp. 2E107 TaxID=3403458 RepID=UPI003AF9BEBB